MRASSIIFGRAIRGDAFGRDARRRCRKYTSIASARHRPEKIFAKPARRWGMISASPDNTQGVRFTKRRGGRRIDGEPTDE